MVSVIRNFCLYVISALFLVACSGDGSVRLTLSDFQTLVNNGFQAPRIVTVELPMSTRAQLYLEAPKLEFADSRKALNWVMDGEVDIDFAGKYTSGRMQVQLEGKADLFVDPKDQTVFLKNVAITGKDIMVRSNLVQMLVMDALAAQVAQGMDNMLLFMIPENSPLASLGKMRAVSYQIEPEEIVFTSEAGS
ncbi:hypothetical protein M3P05_16995 [Sansalvadorimonas sp. 2012CJ34-2]|uniref:Uncharacterized protein n=1 Tax=Parendozoicomonas callyspongiae TaxID=2942213 RepID=A0ABT0PKV8_9GAMM|nr:hypothetical protein [Sansalvadorimonas sp. 2012CJ34-2]MCL6271616.1 hypothetical protein [Sansalvadorimonas sp. 2012CJ34-2]